MLIALGACLIVQKSRSRSYVIGFEFFLSTLGFHCAGIEYFQLPTEYLGA